MFLCLTSVGATETEPNDGFPKNGTVEQKSAPVGWPYFGVVFFCIASARNLVTFLARHGASVTDCRLALDYSGLRINGVQISGSIHVIIVITRLGRTPRKCKRKPL